MGFGRLSPLVRMTQRLVLKETSVYSQGPNLVGAEGPPALSPSLPQDPGLLLLPKRLQAKTTPRGSPFPYLSKISMLSGKCTCGVPGRQPLPAALSLRVWGALLSVSTERSRTHVPCCAASQCPRGWSPQRHTYWCGTLPPGMSFQPCGA